MHLGDVVYHRWIGGKDGRVVVGVVHGVRGDGAVFVVWDASYHFGGWCWEGDLYLAPWSAASEDVRYYEAITDDKGR